MRTQDITPGQDSTLWWICSRDDSTFWTSADTDLEVDSYLVAFSGFDCVSLAASIIGVSSIACSLSRALASVASIPAFDDGAASELLRVTSGSDFDSLLVRCLSPSEGADM